MESKTPTYDVGIYGEIGYDIDAKTFLEALKIIPQDAVVNFHVNSVGGTVWDGIAIYNAIKQMPCKKNVFVDGLAASIASVIAMAGDTVHMCIGSMMMIHNAWTFAAGDAEELSKQADALKKVNESLLDIYEESTMLDREQLAELMKAETWLTAAEAVEYGFATTMDEALTAAACLQGNHLVVNGVSFATDSLKGMPLDKYHAGEEDAVMDLETFKNQHADLYQEIVDSVRAEVQAEKDSAVEAAIASERERMQALDELENKTGAAEIVHRAKYETFQAGEDIAMEILDSVMQEQQKAKERLGNMMKDAAVLDEVDTGKAVPVAQDTAKKNAMQSLLNAVRKEMSK